MIVERSSCAIVRINVSTDHKNDPTTTPASKKECIDTLPPNLERKWTMSIAPHANKNATAGTPKP
jgi:hypothetical protein